jgi:signal peptidase I
VLLLLAALSLLWWTEAFTSWPQVYFMTGASMEPTVGAREYFIATGPVKGLRRGMLVIFRYEDEDGVFHVLRRVAGLPGDTVSLREGRAVVNGRAMAWPFRIVVPKAWRSAYVRGGNLFTWGPAVVPRDSVLLLADTRDMMGWPDSRFIGPVARPDIEAEARRVVWPPVNGRFLKSLRHTDRPAPIGALPRLPAPS